MWLHRKGSMLLFHCPLRFPGTLSGLESAYQTVLLIAGMYRQYDTYFGNRAKICAVHRAVVWLNEQYIIHISHHLVRCAIHETVCHISLYSCFDIHFKLKNILNCTGPSNLFYLIVYLCN